MRTLMSVEWPSRRLGALSKTRSGQQNKSSQSPGSLLSRRLASLPRSGNERLLRLRTSKKKITPSQRKSQESSRQAFPVALVFSASTPGGDEEHLPYHST